MKEKWSSLEFHLFLIITKYFIIYINFLISLGVIWDSYFFYSFYFFSFEIKYRQFFKDLTWKFLRFGFFLGYEKKRTQRCTFEVSIKKYYNAGQ